jgi:hypothetical protein
VNVDAAGLTPSAPARTVTGGFAGYRPVSSLAAHAGVVIDLGRP